MVYVCGCTKQNFEKIIFLHISHLIKGNYDVRKFHVCHSKLCHSKLHIYYCTCLKFMLCLYQAGIYEQYVLKEVNWSTYVLETLWNSIL